MARAISDPLAYREVVICSPFIDELGAQIIERLRHASTRGGARVTVITRQETADWLSLTLADARFRIVVQQRVHAKVYALVGHQRRDHQIVVTSANLTAAGLRRNIEVGLRVTGARAELAPLISSLLTEAGIHIST
jgi:hypothetical protein